MTLSKFKQMTIEDPMPLLFTFKSKEMKKVLILSMTVAIMVSCSLPKQSEATMCTAQEWCDRITCGWVLGNTLASYTDGMPDTADVETCWGNPRTTKEMIDSVAAAGFNALRLSVRWYPHFTDTVNATVDTAWLARVREITDWGLENGMQVMINTDHEEWLELHPFYAYSASVLTKERNLWKQIAEMKVMFIDKDAFASLDDSRTLVVAAKTSPVFA